MTRAENHFHSRKLVDHWNKPSKEQEEIIALRAQLDGLKQARSSRKDKTKTNSGFTTQAKDDG